MRPDPFDLVLHWSAGAFSVPRAAILDGQRGSADTVLARQVAMYLAVVALQWPQRLVADWFGRDRSTVRHALGVIEDRRDDPAFDALIADLEERLRAVDAA